MQTNKIPEIGNLTALLHWADTFPQFLYTTHNGITYPHNGFSHKLRIGKSPVKTTLDNTEAYFGIMPYDHVYEKYSDIISFEKNAKLTSPWISVTDIIVDFDNGVMEGIHPARLAEEIKNIGIKSKEEAYQPFYCDTTKAGYLQQIDQIHHKIREGAFYEMNYCIGFKSDNYASDPVDAFIKLNHHSPMPFASLMKINGWYILSASPERFLKMEHDKVVCQPIKGTRRRGSDPTEDNHLKMELRTSEKELAENVMIVDLTRNDLSLHAKPGSVYVEELAQIYTFKRVHQMISTISAEITSRDYLNIFSDAFPMGSMTGAPKIEVIRNIDLMETSNRGLFSGSIFFSDDSESFDSSVLIRSLFIDPDNKAAFHVGGAITLDADPEEEWKECQVKAAPFSAILDFKF